LGLLIIVFGRKVGMAVMTARVTQAVAWFKCRWIVMGSKKPA